MASKVSITDLCRGISFPSTRARKNTGRETESVNPFADIRLIEKSLVYKLATEVRLDFKRVDETLKQNAAMHVHDFRNELVYAYAQMQEQGWNFGKDFDPEKAFAKFISDIQTTVAERTAKPKGRKR